MEVIIDVGASLSSIIFSQSSGLFSVWHLIRKMKSLDEYILVYFSYFVPLLWFWFFFFLVRGEIIFMFVPIFRIFSLHSHAIFSIYECYVSCAISLWVLGQELQCNSSLRNLELVNCSKVHDALFYIVTGPIPWTWSGNGSLFLCTQWRKGPFKSCKHLQGTSTRFGLFNSLKWESGKMGCTGNCSISWCLYIFWSLFYPHNNASHALHVILNVKLMVPAYKD